MKGFIDYEDVNKLDIQFCKVISGENVPKTNRLYVLKVEVEGTETDIITGLADVIPLDQIVGKNIAFVVNLNPKVIRGIKSNGMLFAYKNSKGEIQLLESPEPNVSFN